MFVLLLDETQVLIDRSAAYAADACKLTEVELSRLIRRIVTIKDRRDVVGGRLRPSDPLALGPGAEEKGAHAGGHADADGGHVALDVLHGIVDGHAGGDGTTGAVDIQLDLLVRVLALQVQQLGHYQRGGGVVDLFAQENDAVVEQAGEDVVGPLAPVGLLYYIGN